MATDFSPILTGILAAAATALNDSGAPLPRNIIAPGSNPAWDGEQLYLKTLDIYPTVGRKMSGPFPQIDTQQLGVGCGVNMLALHLALGVLRCAVTVDDEGNPPDPALISADGLEAYADMAVLLDVLTCALKGQVGGVEVVKLGRWTPSGPQGGLHGGEWEFYIGVDPCIPCG